MLIKNPILILVYLGTLVAISWQLTIFTLVIGPVIIWVMGSIGRKLKANSLVVQSFWSETMSELEETLGGLRVIKAFRGHCNLAVFIILKPLKGFGH